MTANTHVVATSAEPVSIARLSDAELLAQTRSLVGRSNHLLAQLLAHLGEVEARGIHRTRACSSLYTYCIYELRFSEDEAFRRVAAARLVRRFPALLDAVAAGELHLTGLLMLGPHLTTENLPEVMARAKHRTKREIARLVRALDPLPAVPARIEPLGPAPARAVPPEPTWEQFVGALNPVRELEAGERPREWGIAEEQGYDDPASDEQASDPSVVQRTNVERGEQASIRQLGHAHVQASGAVLTASAAVEAIPPARTDAATPGEPPMPKSDTIDGGSELQTPARLKVEPGGDVPTPQRYKVQFTATEEYVRLVDEAKALLSHATPRISLEEVQLRAMRALVDTLRKRKYGTGARVVEAAECPGEPRRRDYMLTRAVAASAANEPDVPALRGADDRGTAANDSEVYANEVETPAITSAPSTESATPPSPRQRGRHIPSAVRRAVAERDGCRCTYVDASGTRCAETRRLEFHHVLPFAVAGSHELGNLTLRCAAHNALAAEEDFGRELIETRRNATRHAPLGEHRQSSPDLPLA